MRTANRMSVAYLEAVADEHPVGGLGYATATIGFLLGHIAWLDQQMSEQAARTARADRLGASQLDSIVSQRDEFWNELVDSRQEIGRLRAELARLHDDPSADLPGTVRISPQDCVFIRADGIDDGIPWARIGPKHDGIQMPFWVSDEDVTGWTRGTPVEGTPAAKAADQ